MRPRHINADHSSSMLQCPANCAQHTIRCMLWRVDAQGTNGTGVGIPQSSCTQTYVAIAYDLSLIAKPEWHCTLSLAPVQMLLWAHTSANASIPLHHCISIILLYFAHLILTSVQTCNTIWSFLR